MICRIANYLLLSALSMAAFLATSHAQGTGQKTFSSSEDALTAFIQAVRDGDPSELGAILGPGTEQIVSSSDSVADKTARESFLKRYEERHSLVPSRPRRIHTSGGQEMRGRSPSRSPIPAASGIGMEKQAKMRFFIAASATMSWRPSTCAKVSVAAQHDYAASAHDGQPAGAYAARIVSEPGKQNGLYWEVKEGEPESPAGPNDCPGCPGRL